MENCVARTNWFKVKDPNALMNAFPALVIENGGHLQIFTRHEDGGIRFAFGSEQEIKGYPDENEGVDIHPFIEKLVDIVADDDVIILQEVRHDKLRYVAAGAYFITSRGWDFVDFSETIYQKACEVTGNKDFKTQLEY